MNAMMIRQRMRGLGFNPTRKRFWLIYGMGFLDALILVWVLR